MVDKLRPDFGADALLRVIIPLAVIVASLVDNLLALVTACYDGVAVLDCPFYIKHRYLFIMLYREVTATLLPPPLSSP
jgi:phage-related holin